MKKAKAESCACRSLSVKMPFTAATSGSISEVMKPQAKNSVVTATKAARTVGLLIRFPPRRADPRGAEACPQARGAATAMLSISRVPPIRAATNRRAGALVQSAASGLQALGIGQLGIVDAR